MNKGEQIVIGSIVIEKVVNRYKIMHNSSTLGLHVVAFANYLEDAYMIAEELN